MTSDSRKRGEIVQSKAAHELFMYVYNVRFKGRRITMDEYDQIVVSVNKLYNLNGASRKTARLVKAIRVELCGSDIMDLDLEILNHAGAVILYEF